MGLHDALGDIFHDTPGDWRMYLQKRQWWADSLAPLVAQGHNLLLQGPAGSGKTMIVQEIMKRLPAPTSAERLEIESIYAAAKLPTPVNRPFRSPHYTISLVGFEGSTKAFGEATLAHGGVLFLDELPEFGRRVLDAVRRVAQDGFVRIGKEGWPACFTLIAAMNLCPCGHRGLSSEEVTRCARDLTCRCSPETVARYQARVDAIRDIFHITARIR